MEKENTSKDRAITIKMTDSELARVDHYADKMTCNRSQLVRNLIRSGLDDLEMMNKTGLLIMALKGFDLLEHVKKSLSKDKYQLEDGKVIIDL